MEAQRERELRGDEIDPRKDLRISLDWIKDRNMVMSLSRTQGEHMEVKLDGNS